MQVHHHCQIQPPLIRPDIGDIRYPCLASLPNLNTFSQPVGIYIGGLAAPEPGLVVATLRPDLVLSHNPRHTLLSAPLPTFPQLIVYTGAAVNAATLIVRCPY